MNVINSFIKKTFFKRNIIRSVSEPIFKEPVQTIRQAISLDFGTDYLNELNENDLKVQGFCEVLNVSSSTTISLCINNKLYNAFICYEGNPLQCYDLRDTNITNRGKAIFAKLMLARFIQKVKKNKFDFLYSLQLQDKKTLYIELLLNNNKGIYNIGKWLYDEKYVCKSTENLDELKFSYKEFV